MLADGLSPSPVVIIIMAALDPARIFHTLLIDDVLEGANYGFIFPFEFHSENFGDAAPRTSNTTRCEGMSGRKLMALAQQPGAAWNGGRNGSKAF